VGDHTFTIDDADRLGGPTWLRTRRLEAAAAALEAPLPSVDAEEWRYSRVAELELSRFRLVDPQSVDRTVPEAAAAVLGGLGDLAGHVVVVDGVVVDARLDAAVEARGVRFGSVGDEGPLGAAMADPTDLFAAFNDAFAAGPVVLDVPRGVDVDRPVAVVNVARTAGGATFPRLSVRAAENSSCSVIEVSVSDDIDALVAPVTELAVGPAAIVRHSALQDLGRDVWQLGSLVAEVDRDATVSAAAAALGGIYARLRLDCRLVGRGATGNLSSVYFGDEEQMLDLRTFQEHRAPDTTSNLMFKGAVADRSHSVYTGLIRILPEGRGTNAFQTNRNLKLSEHAWAESVPNLEIENNEVRCSHASTVGPVDEDQRFYLESRGIPTAAAERLIVRGFFDEVLDDLPVPALAPEVRTRIDALLDRQVGR
jgi:Fe-S cluster assembly protein SufD